MTDLMSFIHDTTFDTLPEVVVEQARRCLLDLVGVAAAGSTTALSRIVRDHAAHHQRGDGDQARLLFDGRAVSPVGAALANATTIDAMDGHDGHRLTKGHAGAAVLPAALALLPANARIEDLVTTLVVGYEMANRCGITLHATARDYHSSGAWNAIGAAAVGARALGLDAATTGHALGIAEYHGPRAPMMRCIDHPTMVKDSSGWGAHTGVSAALLSSGGFTGAPAALTTAAPGDEPWSSLGREWTILDQYLKPYPVCRWAHPAIHATTKVVSTYDITAEDIEHIEVTTFHAATRLHTRTPTTTEHAQYSLPFAVAVAAVRRTLDLEVIADPQVAGAAIHRLAEGIRLRESADMTAAFPAARVAEVTVVLRSGAALHSGPTTAPGDPEEPLTTSDLGDKFRTLARPALGTPNAQALLHLLEAVPNCDLDDLLDRIWR